jgi:hypothetical protein
MKIAVALGFTAAVGLSMAAPVVAEPLDIDNQAFTVGAPCAPAEINRTGVAATGTSVRCVAGITTAGLNWEADGPGIQQIGRLQGLGLNVVVTRTGNPNPACTVVSAAAPDGTDAAPTTVNVTLTCPA